MKICIPTTPVCPFQIDFILNWKVKQNKQKKRLNGATWHEGVYVFIKKGGWLNVVNNGALCAAALVKGCIRVVFFSME